MSEMVKDNLRSLIYINERSGEKTAAQIARDALARIEELEARIAELEAAIRDPHPNKVLAEVMGWAK